MSSNIKVTSCYPFSFIEFANHSKAYMQSFHKKNKLKTNF